MFESFYGLQKTLCLLYGAQNKRSIIDDHMVKLVVQGELG